MSIETELAEIDEELAQLKKTIKQVKKKRKGIIQKIASSDLSFKQKFSYWYKNADKEMSSYLPSHNEFPNLRKFLDEHAYAYDKHEVEDFIEDDGTLACIMYEIACPEECGPNDNMKDKYFESEEACFAVLKEVMDANMSGYTNDW